MTTPDLIGLFRIPPHMIGERLKPRTREQAARERLAYYKALDTEPPWDDVDAHTVCRADGLWYLGEGEAAYDLISTLQDPLPDESVWRRP